MDEQQIFIEAIDNLKEFSILNGGIVTKQDIMDNFGGVELAEGQLQLIYGYLENNHIKISDIEIKENIYEINNNDRIEQQEEINELDLKNDDIQLEIDETNDNKLFEMYIEDLKLIHPSNEKEGTLIQKVLNGDKNAESQLIELYLPIIVKWIEPFRNQGGSIWRSNSRRQFNLNDIY